MLTIFIRAILLYLVMIAIMRGLGRRELGQFQPYEFVMMILLAEIIASPMESVSTPLLPGLIPAAALFSVHCAITIISYKSDKFRAIISGKPVVVMSKGIINEKELKRLCIGLNDLMEGLRSCGMLDPAEVGTAVVEPNGRISAFPRSSCRPPVNSEMNIDAGYEGLPMILVMDGRVQQHNLSQCLHDEKWLADQLGGFGLGLENVFFASIDTKGILTVQDKNGGIKQRQAIPPEEVGW